jgi:hypothetical protein
MGCDSFLETPTRSKKSNLGISLQVTKPRRLRPSNSLKARTRSQRVSVGEKKRLILTARRAILTRVFTPSPLFRRPLSDTQQPPIALSDLRTRAVMTPGLL